jgi:hypothetical protein
MLANLEATLLKEQEMRASRSKLAAYEPYPKQQEFHAAGSEFRERILIAANQVGKTWAAGFEVTMHAAGLYPDWWTHGVAA